MSVVISQVKVKDEPNNLKKPVNHIVVSIVWNEEIVTILIVYCFIVVIQTLARCLQINFFFYLLQSDSSIK